MIYQHNKKQSAISNLQSGSQDGVTLLLAILILSSVMAISFSLAAILFTETRSSADLIRTEPAYYGANGVAEDALFKVKRKTCLPGTCSFTTNFSNNVSMPSLPIPTSTTTPIYQTRVPANSIFSSASRFALYDASSGSLTAGSNYTKMSLTYLDTGTADTLNIWLCEFDPSFGVDPNGDAVHTYNTPPCSDPRTYVTGSSSGYWLHPNVTITRGQTVTWTDLHPSMQQELLLFNPSTTDDIVVNIETFTGTSPNYVPTGIPYAGQTAVEINTTNTTVGRKIRVIIPNSSASVSDQNLALGESASQSSTYTFSPSPVAGLAVDGNTNGDFFVDKTVTHTNLDANAWWQVNLGAPKTINTITIWNRTDGTAATWQRLQDFWIFISNTDLGSANLATITADPTVTKIHDQGTYPNPSRSYSIGTTGQYVRVELNGTNYLHMAEVQVIGH